MTNDCGIFYITLLIFDKKLFFFFTVYIIDISENCSRLRIIDTISKPEIKIFSLKVEIIEYFVLNLKNSFAQSMFKGIWSIG